MSYLALYRKYRPSSFDDVVGQNEVVDIIKNEILNDRISHAYLFSGPRGTGKTSTAKIIAKMINCDKLGKDGSPCGKCESCINFDAGSDVVEIDAASNNGVDEIRDLRDKVNLVPTYGKYKVYIIDEVHMLTTQAFNALLKTLEEPPSHIVFILATTEFYKIPITVVSRCQKFQFVKFSNDLIVERLRYICSNENINVSDEILIEIARLSDGGMRDAINMLDQLASFTTGDISMDDVYKLNGVLSYEEYAALFGYICRNECSAIVNFVENVDKNGKNLNRFVSDFLSFLKDFLIFKCDSNYDNISVENKNIFYSINDLISIDELYLFIIKVNDLAVRLHNSSFISILLVSEFIKISYDLFKDKEVELDKNMSNGSEDKKELDTLKVNAKKDKEKKKNNDEINKKLNKFSDRDKLVRVNNAFALASKDDKESFLGKWNLVVEKVLSDSDYFSITSMVNDIDVMVVGGDYIIFAAKYDSLLDRLYDNITNIENLLFDVYNKKYRVVFLADDEWKVEKEKYVLAFKSGKKYDIMDDVEKVDTNDTKIDADVEKIVSIFGNDVISYE